MKYKVNTTIPLTTNYAPVHAVWLRVDREYTLYRSLGTTRLTLYVPYTIFCGVKELWPGLPPCSASCIKKIIHTFKLSFPQPSSCVCYEEDVDDHSQ